jgi:hypothetical protein
MIPEIRDGVLPEGVHECTIDEIEDTFGVFRHTDRRQKLTAQLKDYLREATLSAVASAVIIDGSYVTRKPEPGDIDLILVLHRDFDPAQEMAPMEYNVQSKRSVRRRYGFDVRAAVEGSDVYEEYLEFFTRIRRDDPEQQTSQPRKGLLRVRL